MIAADLVAVKGCAIFVNHQAESPGLGDMSLSRGDSTFPNCVSVTLV